MDLNTYLNRLIGSVARLCAGRKGLATTGEMNPLEAALYDLRFGNMAAARDSYVEKQRAALGS